MTLDARDNPAAVAERARCVALLRAEAACERNRAISYREDRGLPALEAETIAYLAEESADRLTEIALAVERGEAPNHPRERRAAVARRVAVTTFASLGERPTKKRRPF